MLYLFMLSQSGLICTFPYKRRREKTVMLYAAKFLFAGMAIAAPFKAFNTDSPEKVLAWVGYGIIFALLSIAMAVADHNEK